MKIVNVHQLLRHNHCVHTSQDDQFQLTLQLKTSNYQLQNLFLNVLTMYLVRK